MAQSKEDKYTEAMQALGTYEPAFAPAIHDLAILERELARVRKAWKATVPAGVHPSVRDPHYALIQSLQRDILAHRDALGLTPKGLRRLRGREVAAPVDPQSEISRRLDALADRCEAYDGPQLLPEEAAGQ